MSGVVTTASWGEADADPLADIGELCRHLNANPGYGRVNKLILSKVVFYRLMRMRMRKRQFRRWRARERLRARAWLAKGCPE